MASLPFFIKIIGAFILLSTGTTIILAAQEIQYPVDSNLIPPEHAQIQGKILKIDKTYSLSDQTTELCSLYGCKATVQITQIGALGMGFQPFTQMTVEVVFSCTLAPITSQDPILPGLKKNQLFEALIRSAESSNGYAYTIDTYQRIPKK